MAERLRAAPGSFGMVGLNGGFQSKYGAAVLSTAPREWPGCESAGIQAALDAAPRAALADMAEGAGHIGTYTVTYAKGVPEQVIIIGELERGGRFIATSRAPDVIATALADDPIGRAVSVVPGEKRNQFTFA
jgi:acetyl-CoA C-acetyltransferase